MWLQKQLLELSGSAFYRKIKQVKDILLSKIILLAAIILIAGCDSKYSTETKPLQLTLQIQDPNTDHIITNTENVNSANVGVVIVDPWNYHWCMTACERVSAMVPRWNRALEVARKLEMPIVWVPSDVVGTYSGYLQRERALGVELLKVPVVKEMPQAIFTAPVGKCMCGPGINCIVNYGHDAINPALFLGDNDFIASSTEEVYTLFKEKGITHVIYMGLHTNMCLYGKPGALKYLWQTGLKCMVARDINDAFTTYDPYKGFTPDKGTQQTDEDLERAGIPLINVVEEWQKAGLWDENWIVETVRIAPWGKPDRPYFFRQSTTITLTTPWLKDVDIRYTLDGSDPTNSSPVYQKPLTISKTTNLRTAAFRKKNLVSVPTSAYFVLLPPEPKHPDIYLDNLNYMVDPYGQIHPGFVWEPKKGTSYEELPLRIRGKLYEKGMGFAAPSAVRYELKPEYDSFVAKAGIDDNMLDNHKGCHLAMHCSVVFRVFIDGNLMAESPVMRISQEPWPFDVKIPQGSRYINLVCMDAGSRNIMDLGNWVDSGFCLK